MDTEFFEANVITAIVPDPKAEGGKRDAQYIPAQSIPLAILEAMLGYGIENKRHPHNIPGMAWDLTVRNWRNMKNAQVIEQGEQQVVWDPSTAEKFFAS